MLGSFEAYGLQRRRSESKFASIHAGLRCHHQLGDRVGHELHLVEACELPPAVHHRWLGPPVDAQEDHLVTYPARLGC